MPRKPRFVLPGVPQHIIQRGNNRGSCFIAEQDYRRYLKDLAITSGRHGCSIHAYVLMSNHVHLLLTPALDHGIAEMMQTLGQRYVCYFNKTYQRTGTLWEGRYKACLVDSEAYLLTCMRYIELNPVRAGMVAHVGDYPWSSHGVNAQGREDSLISPHPLYLALGRGVTERQQAYRELFGRDQDAALLHEIRAALNHELVLGRAYFKGWVETLTHRQTGLGAPGRPRLEEEAGVYQLDEKIPL